MSNTMDTSSESSLTNVSDAFELERSFDVKKTRKALESSDIDILSNIYDEMINMVVWQRSLSSECTENVESILSIMPTLKIEEKIEPKNAYSLLKESLKAVEDRDAFCEDVATLVDMFCCLFDLRAAGLRLSILDNAMCPRFHVDHVPCRLVTTYIGDGTQWIAHEKVNRAKLGLGSGGLLDEESGLYASASDIHHISNGEVALLKGESWSGNEDAGLVHRSAFPKPGDKRLLLTLDFAF